DQRRTVRRAKVNGGDSLHDSGSRSWGNPGATGIGRHSVHVSVDRSEQGTLLDVGQEDIAPIPPWAWRYATIAGRNPACRKCFFGVLVHVHGQANLLHVV